jgi:hypothetical protein
MPFKSEAQRRYLWMHEPEIAKKWTHEGKNKGLPKHKKKKDTGFYGHTTCQRLF